MLIMGSTVDNLVVSLYTVSNCSASPFKMATFGFGTRLTYRVELAQGETLPLPEKRGHARAQSIIAALPLRREPGLVSTVFRFYCW